MAKTLLDYVQTCLSAMESDNVDTVNDTTEALDTAKLLKEVYYELLAREDWPFLKRAITLTAVADTATPTSFTIPETIKMVEELSYNISEIGSYKRRPLQYMEPRCFIAHCQSSETATNAQLVELGSSIKLWVRNDQWPMFYTSFTNDDVVMDSFHSDFESTLTTAKLQGFGVAIPSFTVDDTFTPDIPLNMEPLLQASLNTAAFRYFKQVVSEGDTEKERRQMARGRREASKVDRPRDTFYRNHYGRR